MRLIVDSLIALMLVGIFAAVLLHYQQQQRRLEDIRFVHRSLARLHEQATYHGALDEVKDTAGVNPSDAVADADTATSAQAYADRFPARIAPDWFGEHLPLNVLVSTHQPWIDLAPPDDQSAHPPDPVIRDGDEAGFWYNPNRGIFRARVPAQFSTQETLRLYNRVNGTALLSLPAATADGRAPQPHPLMPEANQRRAARQSAETHVEQMFQTLTGVVPTSLTPGPATARADNASPADPSSSDSSSPTEPAADDANAAPDPSEADRNTDAPAKPSATASEAGQPTTATRPTLLNTIGQSDDAG